MADSSVQTQIYADAPEIQAYKLGLLESGARQVEAINQAATQGQYLQPDYKVAGFSQDQLDALGLGREGIGAYQPYMNTAQQAVMAGYGTTGQALDLMKGADTRGQFVGARAAMDAAGRPIQQMGGSAQLVTQGTPLIAEGATGMRAAQQMADRYAQANMNQALGTLGRAEQVAAGAAPTDFSRAYGTLGQGIGALQGAAGMYDPRMAQGFMNPYQQAVIDESIRQINRQGDIAMQGVKSQAARAGAFGGARDAIQRAELQRALAEQKNAAIVGGLQQGYQSALGQSQQAFEQQQQRQLAQAQGLQSAAGMQGQFGQTQQQQALQQAAALQGIGTTYGQQALQQAQLGQGAAGLQGNIGGQLANLANIYGNLGAQQANIYGQQSQLGQQQALGYGTLAGQEFDIGSRLAQGVGALGAQQAAMGMNAAQLGQMEQQLGQQDVNFLYNLGAQQQRQQQTMLDVARQNQLQKNMQPLQMLGFLSDLYKGSPTSQMGITTQSQASPSPFQQIVGLGIGATSAAAAANKAGLF